MEYFKRRSYSHLIVSFCNVVAHVVVGLLLTTSAFAAQHSYIQNIEVPVKTIHSYRPVAYFTTIEVGDNFKVVMGGLNSRPGIELIGKTDCLAKVITVVQGNRLVLSLDRPDTIPPAHRHVLVKINAPPNLLVIYAAGNAEVILNAVHSPGLSIYARDWAQVIVHGLVILRKIETCSARNIVVDLTRSRHLVVAATGIGTVYVHGSAHILSARLWQKACLEAQNLRTQKVYVEVDQQSIAKVWPIHALYAFARGFGNIYYYHKPTILLRHTEQSGNILQVANK